MSEDPLRDVLAYVARRPLRPPSFMALVLKQDPLELQARLDAATALGWLAAQRACCGREWRYEATDAGRAVVRA